MREEAVQFRPGNLVRARGREWVVLPERRPDILKLRPLGGAESDSTLIYLPLESEPPVPATFDLPDPEKPGSLEASLLLRDALRLKLRAGAGPFRSFGNIKVDPRAYQLVPLLMALKLDTVRLLIADDVGIGKTIEAGLIARELIDRGEINRVSVICPPHLCEQWQRELAEKFSLEAEVVRTGTVKRLERGLQPDESVFEVYPFTIVSLDYIKSDRRRDDFLRTCPEFVIVDEAHTCVQSTSTSTRHQRYKLLKGLAESKPSRNMLFLTATPHSGDDTAFHNLLGLLKPEFTELANMPKGEARNSLRGNLAQHFVQRRRGDIDEWKDAAGFPSRESRESTYSLTGDWGKLFDDVLIYARTMVKRAESDSKLRQRMSWWAALALLRCVSSSPAAASLALRTRLQAAEERMESEQIAELDQSAGETVMDEVADDSLTLNESVPSGTVESPEDADELCQLINRADDLRGPKRDPKLKTLINDVRELQSSGYKPVVFCRYIATAHYVGKQLRLAFNSKKTHVIVVTGELTPDQREERIEALEDLDSNVTPLLVATDCLSEGVNLQRHFNAVVHYDLTWNPTRHEQREGRADRFGQESRIVRTLMLYGKDNPVDGAVLRVILRKAEKIRKELGVSVPLPTDNNKVIDAIMKAILLQDANSRQMRQISFDFADTEAEVDKAWDTARDNWQAAHNEMTHTVFAQQRMRPDDVLPEWHRTVSVLGGQSDVARFVRLCAEHLGAPLDQRNGYSRMPVAHLPKPLQDRLEIIGFKSAAKISFVQPVAMGAVYIHRAHPLVATLADYITEQALDTDKREIGARASAIYTEEVRTRTVLYLLRLRSQIQVEKRGEDGSFVHMNTLLAEECLGVAIMGDNAPELLTESDALSLLSLKPGRNMEDGQKTYLIRQALDAIPLLEDTFREVARKRSRQLLDDHRRVRDASDAKGLRYSVEPAFPVDKIGVYVFMPIAIM